jgi:hypothetical protein
MSLSRKPRRFVRKPAVQLNVRVSVDPPTATLMKDMCALWKRKQGEVFRDALEARRAQMSPEERRALEVVSRSRQDAPERARRGRRGPTD